MRRILITSALPYINGVKHLGNLAGSMLPADVYARAMRLLGHDVLYICATDEHGTPAELAAAADGMEVAAYCEAMHRKQAEAGAGFKLSYDHFGRSSSPENHRLTQHFAHRLEANGLIEERESEQVWSEADGRFLPDRYVEGTCPNCAHRPARGDQCDSCGKLLDPVDLIDPYSAISGSADVELRTTRHLYLLQSKLEGRLRDWVEASEGWPNLASSIALKWLDEGLRDRAITRDLSWGIPVTNPDGSVRDGFAGKVFYVWFDAPIAYIAATENATPDWKSWWRTDVGEPCEYVQFMGKDNVAFHTLSFPVTLIGSGEPWKLVDRLKAFNWVSWYGGKFSTSQGRGVFMDEALSIAPSDTWRWYLSANAPESADTEFTWETFQASVNSDLANVLGNFVNRITKYAGSKFDGVVPEVEAEEGAEEGADEAWLREELATRLPAMVAHFEAREFRKGCAEMRSVWAAGNEYLTRAAPWTHYKTDVARAATGVRVGLNLAALFGVIAQPVIPDAAERILDAMGVPVGNRTWNFEGDLLDALPRGHAVHAPPVLFAKVEDADVVAWTERFGGGDADGDGDA